MLYVIVATRGQRQHTQRLLGALAVVRPEVPMRVVLVDQASTDDTVAWAQQLGPAVSVIANRLNTGAASAWNMGIRIAVENRAEAILICGYDTFPWPGTVERLWGLLNEGVLFATGTAVPYDAEPCPVVPAMPDEPLISAPDFSFFMFRPIVIDAVAAFDMRVVRERSDTVAVMHPWQWGLFDCRMFPAYWEDNDLHHRMRQGGVLAVSDPCAFFGHDCSLTLRTDAEVAALNQKTFQANAELFKAKWGGLPHELDIQQARPLNVTDEQWAHMSGGHAVLEMSRAELRERAQGVYARHGVRQ